MRSAEDDGAWWLPRSSKPSARSLLRVVGSIPATSAVCEIGSPLMQVPEQPAVLYRDLAPLIADGDKETVISLLAHYYHKDLDPDTLFAILIRIGVRNYSYEIFQEQVPHALFAASACHSLSKHLEREDAMLAMVQAAVYLAHDAHLHEAHDVAPDLGIEAETPESLGERLLAAIADGELARADGALELLRQLPGTDTALPDYLFRAASLDHRNLGHKLIMATLLFQAVGKLGGEIAFGLLRPAVHYAASGVDKETSERISAWVEEVDLEDRTLFAHKRELTMQETLKLAEDILYGEHRRAVNHVLRNDCSLSSFLDALAVAASEWVRQDFAHPVVAIHRFTYAHAVRVALSYMDRFALWPLLNAVELLREDWKGEEFAPMELSVQFTGPKEVAGWAARQDAEPTAAHVHKFAYAFLAEDRQIQAELKPFLHRAYFALRDRVPDASSVREAFEEAAV